MEIIGETFAEQPSVKQSCFVLTSNSLFSLRRDNDIVVRLILAVVAWGTLNVTIFSLAADTAQWDCTNVAAAGILKSFL